MLEFRNVCVNFGSRNVLKDVSFSLRPHRLTVLLGRNGSGKSTLLRCLNQELPYTGQILEGEKNLAFLPPKERARTVAVLPQTMPSPHITLEELVTLGRNPYLDLTGRLGMKDKETVHRAMVDADVLQLRERYVDTLSGGERQRGLLGMILAQNTPIALLDEPTAHMDQLYEASFLKLLCRIKQQRKKTFLVILHDLTLAAEYADDLVILDSGEIRFAGTKEECLRCGIIEKTFGVKCFRVGESGREKVFFSAE